MSHFCSMTRRQLFASFTAAATDSTLALTDCAVATASSILPPANAACALDHKDIASLNDYEDHLSNKVQFLLDAILGFITIQQNDLFKVLTIVSVVGIPPTLVAGIYGMNFKYMPELSWAEGYPFALAAIVLQRCPLVLRIDALQLNLDARNSRGVLTNEFLQSYYVFLFLFLVFLRLFGLIDLRVLWLRHALGHTAAVRALVGQHEFLNIYDVIRRNQLV